MKTELTTKTTSIKPSSPVDLAKLYGVCDKTFKKWLKPFEAAIGERIGRYYSIAQVRIIFEKLGEPGEG
ncbi:hypothetical protein ACFOWM_05545 [Ferruginibacter yonginensis]|uniref:HTH merR-type domain-containing protein n=1 Tax=Ferruginibacter yonginensis TaxID=1310416 RepID=A0ABV8QQG9_9BACT